MCIESPRLWAAFKTAVDAVARWCCSEGPRSSRSQIIVGIAMIFRCLLDAENILKSVVSLFWCLLAAWVKWL